jgi:hypothetical protein
MGSLKFDFYSCLLLALINFGLVVFTPLDLFSLGNILAGALCAHSAFKLRHYA